MLNEYNGIYRQVFTDGRPCRSPNPSWQGYSTATWAGDTLVIETHRIPRRPVDRLGRQHDHEGRAKSVSESGGPTSVTSRSR